MATSKSISNKVSVSSSPINGFKPKLLSLNNISQIKHINRIRKCAKNNIQNHQDNNVRNRCNQSCLKVYDHYHLSNSPVNLEKENVTNRKNANSECKHKFLECDHEIKNYPLKSLKTQRSSCGSDCNQNSSMNQQSINSQVLYDIPQMKHISRIRSLSNIPVSFTLCRRRASETEYTELDGINLESEKCPRMLQSEENSEKLSTREQKVREKTSKLLETEHSNSEYDLVCQSLIHSSINSQSSANSSKNNVNNSLCKANSNPSSVGNIHHLQRNERNQIKSIGKSEFKETNSEGTKKANSTKQKHNGNLVSNNPNGYSYRENTASKQRKGTKARQDNPLDDKEECIMTFSKKIRDKNSEEYEQNMLFPSESFRISVNVVNSNLKTEGKMNLNKEDDFLYLSSGDDCESKMLRSSTSTPQLSKHVVKKRKTWL
nr:uncharacterized protein DDB_G0287625-like [Parasteatoda tepidariorum]